MSSSELIISALLHLSACITDFRGWDISAASALILDTELSIKLARDP